MGARKNGYILSGNPPFPGAFVYIDGTEQKKSFTLFFTVPVIFEYGPRWHYQNALATGENWYDTCYYFWTVNLTDTAIQPPEPM